MRRRAWWKRHQSKIDPARLVFIDETWAKTNMTRTHGWWRRGAPLRAQVPHGHWRTMTFLAALRHDRIAAPCVIDGPINGESFRAYVELSIHFSTRQLSAPRPAATPVAKQACSR